MKKAGLQMVNWRSLSGLLAMACLGGCTAIPGLKPATSDSSQLPGIAPLPDSRLVSNNAASLQGRLTVPPDDLVSTYVGGFVNLGGAAYYRAFRHVASLNAQPLAGVRVHWADADGQRLGLEEALTDAQGNFALASRPTNVEVPYVQAEFESQGAPVRFRTWIEPAASTADLDVATTMISDKLGAMSAAGTPLTVAGTAIAQLRELVAQLRSALEPGTLPYMDKRSSETVAGFDQLLMDRPDLRAKALQLGAAMERPTERWQTRTLLRPDDCVRLGLIPDATTSLFAAGFFEVDASGDLYLPRMPQSANDAVEIRAWRSGETTTRLYATLPVSLRPPVNLARSIQGHLYALGKNGTSNQLELYRLDPSETPTLVASLPLSPTNMPAGGVRLAIDDRGAVPEMFFPVRLRHTVIRYRFGETSLTVVAGAGGVAGFANGDATSVARLNFPTEVALSPTGWMYISDWNNNAIRWLNPQRTQVGTIVGQPGGLEARNGRFSNARVGNPDVMVPLPDGSLVFTDLKSRMLRRLSAQGSVFFVAGSGQNALADGSGAEASFHRPMILRAATAKRLFMADLADANSATKEPDITVPLVIRVMERE